MRNCGSLRRNTPQNLLDSAGNPNAAVVPNNFTLSEDVFIRGRKGGSIAAKGGNGGFVFRHPEPLSESETCRRISTAFLTALP